MTGFCEQQTAMQFGLLLQDGEEIERALEQVLTALLQNALH